jgi:hypothetical protein
VGLGTSLRRVDDPERDTRVLPTPWLAGLPRLDVCLNVEEVLDLVEREPGSRLDVLEIAVALVAWTLGRDAQHLVVTAGFIDHPKHADRSHPHMTPGEGALVERHEHVEEGRRPASVCARKP